MQKFIVQTISIVASFMFANSVSMAQEQSEKYSFYEIASLFHKNQIHSPFNVNDLLKLDMSSLPQIECHKYNWLIIKGQSDKARRCNIDGKYFKASYGLISDDAMSFSSDTYNVKGLYTSKIYALGFWKCEKYNVFLVRVECIRNTFIDMFTFTNDGKVLSMLCLYEDEGGNYCDKVPVDSVFISSDVSSDDIIHYEENRYGVNVKIDYQLQDDGVLKEISKSIIGQYEVVDNDGYVNVREKPDGKSKILYTIESGSVIISRSDNGSKWEEVISIEDSNKKGGYIHSSRLRNYW